MYLNLIGEVNGSIYDFTQNNGNKPEFVILTNNKFDILSAECKFQYDKTESNKGFIATYKGIPVIDGDKCLIL